MSSPNKPVAPTPAVGPVPRPTILVADDEDGVLALLKIALDRAGFLVLTAADGHQAVELAAGHRGDIDLALLDVRMPGLDGPGALAALQQLRPGVRCWFMSGDMGQYSEQALLALGAERLIRKPFDLAALTADLRIALQGGAQRPGPES
jgi:CheY-like chemotaxis protein